jgi:tRNA 2-(methylsulfanyl)-N6-isopentenyladenosine37 hydroxylase
VLCLTHPTDPAWVELALADLPGVLADHAHCEMKAASNALSLAARSPAFPRVVRALVELAEEELRHFRAVLEELDRRGVALGKPPSDVYAAELRKLASGTAKRRTAEDSLVDRLLVGALIEARSCERFRLLADALAARGEEELSAFYDELFAAEARHFRTLVDLAGEAAGDAAKVRERLDQLARAEGTLAARLGKHASIHG